MVAVCDSVRCESDVCDERDKDAAMWFEGGSRLVVEWAGPGS